MFLFSGKSKNAFSRYADPTGEFSNAELTWAVLWQRHKAVIQKIGMAILILWCVGAGLFVLISGIWYAAVGFSSDQKMGVALVRSFQNFSAVQGRYAALPISVRDVGVFQTAPGTYDAIGTIANPNRDWIAHIAYRAVFSGGESDPAETILLPQTERPIGVFGMAHASIPRNIAITIDALRWERVSAHTIPDVGAFMNDRLSFGVSDFVFSPAGSLSGVQTNGIRFVLENQRPYRFRRVEIWVDALQGSGRVATLRTVLDDVLANQKIPIDLRWFSDGVTVTAIKVFPVVNIFDPSVYRAPK